MVGGIDGEGLGFRRELRAAVRAVGHEVVGAFRRASRGDDVLFLGFRVAGMVSRIDGEGSGFLFAAARAGAFFFTLVDAGGGRCDVPIAPVVVEAGDGGFGHDVKRKLVVELVCDGCHLGVRAGLDLEGEVQDLGVGGDGVKGRVGDGDRAVGSVDAEVEAVVDGACTVFQIGQRVGIVGDDDLSIVGRFGLREGNGHTVVGIGLTGRGGVDGGVGRLSGGDGVQTADDLVRGFVRRSLVEAVLRCGSGDARLNGVGQQVVAGDVESFKGRGDLSVGLVLNGGGSRGAVDIEAGGGPDALAEVAGVIDSARGGIDDDEFRNVIAGVAPINVGAVVIEVLIEEVGGDAGVNDKGRRAEGDGGADAHRGLPDLAAFIQEVERGGGGADASGGDSGNVDVADVGLRCVEQTVGQTGDSAVILVFFGRKVTEDQIARERIHKVAGVTRGGAGKVEDQNKVVAEFRRVVVRTVDGVKRGRVVAGVQRGGVERGGVCHEGGIEVHGLRGRVRLGPRRDIGGVEA